MASATSVSSCRNPARRTYLADEGGFSLEAGGCSVTRHLVMKNTLSIAKARSFAAVALAQVWEITVQPRGRVTVFLATSMVTSPSLLLPVATAFP
jgi:hypothetical protein